MPEDRVNRVRDVQAAKRGRVRSSEEQSEASCSSGKGGGQADSMYWSDAAWAAEKHQPRIADGREGYRQQSLGGC